MEGQGEDLRAELRGAEEKIGHVPAETVLGWIAVM
jgi:hypothetical protein